MPIDHSLYMQQRGTNSNPGESLERGMRMRDLYDKKQLQNEEIKKQKSIDEAYKSGVTIGPDGKPTFDRNKTLASMAKVGGREYLEAEGKFASQDAAQRKAKMESTIQEVEMVGQVAGSIIDQPSYDQGLATLQKAGIDISKMPRQFDPNLVKSYQARALKAGEKLRMDFDREWKEKNYQLDKEKVAIQRAEAQNKKTSGEKLPIDQKKLVETLATKNANKISIANQIESVVNKWDTLSEDQQIALGGQLLKTLNSPEGADAIGVEEANRLGNKLQFAMGNFTNSNPTRVGRDLKGFKEQAQNTMDTIRTAVQSNKAEIDRALGRTSGEAQDLNQLPDSEIDKLYKQVGGQ